MRFDLTRHCWLEREPPGLCHTGLEALFAAGTAGAAGGGFSALSAIGTVASIGGTLLGAKAQADQAAYQSAVAEAEAAALRQKAEQEAAAAQRTAITRERQTELVQSRARALAASSGTLATSPSEVDLESDIAAQGEYNALSALYEGMAASRATSYQADINLFKARRISSAAPWAVGGTLLSGIGAFADRRSLSRTSAGSGTSFFGL